MFNINFDALGKAILAFFMRQPIELSWVYTFLRGLKDLYMDFQTYSAQMLFQAGITGQVIYLETLLNKEFNSSIPAWTWDSVNYLYVPNTPLAIYILDNPNRIQPTVLWTRAENRPPLYLYTRAEVAIHSADAVLLYTRAEYAQQPDFIVYVPTSLANVTTDVVFVTQMKGWLNKYRQAGSRYLIVNY